MKVHSSSCARLVQGKCVEKDIDLTVQLQSAKHHHCYYIIACAYWLTSMLKCISSQCD